MEYILTFIYAIFVACKMCQALLVEEGIKKLKFLIFLFYESTVYKGLHRVGI